MAYVDTEAGPTPPQIGQIQGTPTIKAFVPKRASAKNEKSVVDYDQAREVTDLVRFATGRMPNYVEAINGAGSRMLPMPYGPPAAAPPAERKSIFASFEETLLAKVAL